MDELEELRGNVASLRVKVRALLDDLEEARLQLAYMDERAPTGTTPAVIARIDATLAKHRSAP